MEPSAHFAVADQVGLHMLNLPMGQERVRMAVVRRVQTQSGAAASVAIRAITRKGKPRRGDGLCFLRLQQPLEFNLTTEIASIPAMIRQVLASVLVARPKVQRDSGHPQASLWLPTPPVLQWHRTPSTSIIGQISARTSPEARRSPALRPPHDRTPIKGNRQPNVFNRGC
jgi:hypothetical protein